MTTIGAMAGATAGDTIAAVAGIEAGAAVVTDSLRYTAEIAY